MHSFFFAFSGCRIIEIFFFTFLFFILCIAFTFQIHIHIHIFGFPPINQLTHIASNCAPDAPKTAWRRTTNCVPT